MFQISVLSDRSRNMSNFVKFTTVRSAIDCTFWAKFAELKLDKYKLDEKAINLWGMYSLESLNAENNNPLTMNYSSFNEDVETIISNSSVVCMGHMVNINTWEAFRRLDPEKFISTLSKHMILSIQDGSILQRPWDMSLFLIISYSDLKIYRFYYWVAHPTPLNLPEMYYQEEPKPVAKEFCTSNFDDLCNGFLQLDGRSKNYFAVLITHLDKLEVVDLATGVNAIEQNKVNPNKSQEYIEVYFAFYDPCTSSQPGWPLRNLLCLLLWHCPTYFSTNILKFISIRGNKAQSSIVFKLKAKEYPDINEIRKQIFECPLVGWERNAASKMGPSYVDLSHAMDPTKLSDKAINLNLKLMKWRLVPDLDLNKIVTLKCLLLGAGTLGCAVARVLLGWGVNNITFVDSSKVSHSNTVRQSLYSHEDAVKHKYKAHAARDALLKIRPSMNADGVILHIPMPGHVVGESMMESTKKSFEQLEELIKNHDVVFLLLDSREARWLPTVLCASMKKITINAALGFDSYTVQRHGQRTISSLFTPDFNKKIIRGSDLGCYFCNDVTQPGNSQTDRTLDQQCTVSRPGLSHIAAGLAVELLVAITQHPEGPEAGALMNNTRDNDASLEGVLGCVPHTIRGSLWNYDMQLTITHRFTACTACSVPVILEYEESRFAFVLEACNTPKYLEKLSGLEALLQRPNLDDLCYTWDNTNDDDN